MPRNTQTYLCLIFMLAVLTVSALVFSRPAAANCCFPPPDCETKICPPGLTQHPD
jgi:hypothetical protein